MNTKKMHTKKNIYCKSKWHHHDAGLDAGRDAGLDADLDAGRAPDGVAIALESEDD